MTGRAALRVPDWRTALDAVSDWAGEGQLLLVFDEFQFIARENRDIGSIINVWWRERGEQLPIFVVLSGSEVGFFEREVVSYSATTYGRRAGQRRLRPFAARDVELFLPTWSAEDKVAAYAVFGHMPYYRARLRDIDRELDAVAIDDDGGVIAVGSCKWTAGPLPYAERAKLELLGSHLAPDGPPPQLYFFARNGFEHALAREAETSDRIQLISPQHLFPARTPAASR